MPTTTIASSMPAAIQSWARSREANLAMLIPASPAEWDATAYRTGRARGAAVRVQRNRL
jgi:hypothetical protein